MFNYNIFEDGDSAKAFVCSSITRLMYSRQPIIVVAAEQGTVKISLDLPDASPLTVDDSVLLGELFSFILDEWMKSYSHYIQEKYIRAPFNHDTVLNIEQDLNGFNRSQALTHCVTIANAARDFFEIHWSDSFRRSVYDSYGTRS